MPFVSITRLRIRSLWRMPAFLILTGRVNRQVCRSLGFVSGSLLADSRRTFWTVTLWDDSSAMKAFLTSGAHGEAMSKLMTWCDEASVVHWSADDASVPNWIETHRRMVAEGRRSKVKWPTEAHRDWQIPAPNESSLRTVPLLAKPR